MAYVIGEKCLGERYADCVEVCPVDCIYPGEFNPDDVEEDVGFPTDLAEEHAAMKAVFMVIDPELCIDCTLCKPACPIDAIYETEEEDPVWASINAQLAASWKDNEPVEVRPRDEPPRRSGNEIINP